MSRSISLRACWGSIIISVENPWWFWHGIFIVFDMEFMIKMLIQNRSHLSNKEESLYVKASSSYDACRCHAPVRSNQSKISRKSVENQSKISRKAIENRSKSNRKSSRNSHHMESVVDTVMVSVMAERRREQCELIQKSSFVIQKSSF